MRTIIICHRPILPFDYTATIEIPPGRGLLSGEDGAFTFGVPYGDGSAEAPMSGRREDSSPVPHRPSASLPELFLYQPVKAEERCQV
jgi:hypothetical protein